jgi:hypothetical protein
VRALIVFAAALVAVPAASAGVSLRIEVARGPTFSLRCDPAGGTLPFAPRVCRDIAAHPQAMLAPTRARSLCVGGPNMPGLTVTLDGHASLNGSPFCNWPGGTALGIYWAASRHDAAMLARVEPRLRCDDDPALLVKPTPWASVAACVHGRWTPRTERLIRIAGRVPALDGFFPARLFPVDIGARRCTIPTGGLAMRRLRGTCGVNVTRVWGTPTVAFVERWPTATGSARHMWRVIVRRGRPTLADESGPTPPQRRR